MLEWKHQKKKKIIRYSKTRLCTVNIESFGNKQIQPIFSQHQCALTQIKYTTAWLQFTQQVWQLQTRKMMGLTLS